MIDAPRFVRFIFVGGSSGVLLICLTWLFVDGLNLPVILGSSIAITLTAMYHYCMHYYWTFSSDIPHGWALVKYLVMCLGTLGVNGLVMYVGVHVLTIHYLVVQFLANVAVALWTFSISSLWVFARKG